MSEQEGNRMEDNTSTTTSVWRMTAHAVSTGLCLALSACYWLQPETMAAIGCSAALVASVCGWFRWGSTEPRAFRTIADCGLDRRARARSGDSSCLTQLPSRRREGCGGSSRVCPRYHLAAGVSESGRDRASMGKSGVSSRIGDGAKNGSLRSSIGDLRSGGSGIAGSGRDR